MYHRRHVAPDTQYFNSPHIPVTFYTGVQRQLYPYATRVTNSCSCLSSILNNFYWMKERTKRYKTCSTTSFFYFTSHMFSMLSRKCSTREIRWFLPHKSRVTGMRHIPYPFSTGIAEKAKGANHTSRSIRPLFQMLYVLYVFNAQYFTAVYKRNGQLLRHESRVTSVKCISVNTYFIPFLQVLLEKGADETIPHMWYQIRLLLYISFVFTTFQGTERFLPQKSRLMNICYINYPFCTGLNEEKKSPHHTRRGALYISYVFSAFSYTLF